MRHWYASSANCPSRSQRPAGVAEWTAGARLLGFYAFLLRSRQTILLLLNQFASSSFSLLHSYQRHQTSTIIINSSGPPWLELKQISILQFLSSWSETCARAWPRMRRRILLFIRFVSMFFFLWMMIIKRGAELAIYFIIILHTYLYTEFEFFESRTKRRNFSILSLFSQMLNCSSLSLNRINDLLVNFLSFSLLASSSLRLTNQLDGPPFDSNKKKHKYSRESVPNLGSSNLNFFLRFSKNFLFCSKDL